MSYTPNVTWADGAAGGTGITAAKLNHIESGIVAAALTGDHLTLPVALTDGATIALDATLGNLFTVTLSGNRTLATPTGPTDGQRILLQITQDGTGSRTLTLPGNFNVVTTVTGAITLSTAAGKVDYLGAIYRAAGSKWDVLSFAAGY